MKTTLPGGVVAKGSWWLVFGQRERRGQLELGGVVRGGGGGDKVREDNGDWCRYGGEGWLLVVVELVSRSVTVAGVGAMRLACAGAGAGAGVVCLVEIGVRVGRVVRKESWSFGAGTAAAAATESEGDDEPGEEEGEGAAAGCDACYGGDWKLRGAGIWGGGWSRGELGVGRNDEVGRCCDGYDRGRAGGERQSGSNGDCCLGLEDAEGG